MWGTIELPLAIRQFDQTRTGRGRPWVRLLLRALSARGMEVGHSWVGKSGEGFPSAAARFGPIGSQPRQNLAGGGESPEKAAL